MSHLPASWDWAREVVRAVLSGGSISALVVYAWRLRCKRREYYRS